MRSRTKQSREAEKKIYLGYVNEDETMDEEENSLYHMGFLPLSSIYHRLNIHQFMINRQRSLSSECSLNDVLQYMVYDHVLSSGSKIAGLFYCDLHDVDCAMEYIASLQEKLLLYIHNQVRIHTNRKAQTVFHYVTDELHSPSVHMGLFLDADDIPITYYLLQGSTCDSQTMMPIIKKTRAEYELGRMITVADKDLNRSDNMIWLMSKGDGFLYSQRIQNADRDHKSYVLDPEGYVDVSGFRMKSRVYPQEFYVIYPDDHSKVPVKVKQIVCYNENDARQQKHKRAEVLGKVNNESAPCPDMDKIAEDEKFDGYYSFITGETDMPDLEVIKTYYSSRDHFIS